MNDRGDAAANSTRDDHAPPLPSSVVVPQQTTDFLYIPSTPRPFVPASVKFHSLMPMQPL